MNAIEQIKEMEEKLELMKKNHAEEIKEEKEKEKAGKFFKKHFNLFISDDYNIYPEEYTYNLESRFINNMWQYTDEKGRLRVIEELKQEYLELIKSDIEMLQKEYERIKGEVEE